MNTGADALFTATVDGEDYVVQIKVGAGTAPEKVINMLKNPHVVECERPQPTCCRGSFRSTACGNCGKLGQFTDGALVVRCSKCHGQLIYKWLDSTEVEVYHLCRAKEENA